MKFDLWQVYEPMLRSRLFEEAVISLWKQGYISGEMHLSIGDEAIVAGTVLQMQQGDALALDYRGTAALVMRGVDLASLLNELLGQPNGLCAGQAGHMHLLSKDHLAACSGIVGASGPAAVGFALAARYLRPRKISLGFFGEGAINQGMLMEAMNLAVVWKLPVIFICRDNQWSITTVSSSVTGGGLIERAKGLGLPTHSVPGHDVQAVWKVAQESFNRAREGGGPSFIHTKCIHPEGHLLGDPILRIKRQPVKELTKMAGPLLWSLVQKKGTSLKHRSSSLQKVMILLKKRMKARTFNKKDPINVIEEKLKSDEDRLIALQVKMKKDMQELIAACLTEEIIR